VAACAVLLNAGVTTSTARSRTKGPDNLLDIKKLPQTLREESVGFSICSEVNSLQTVKARPSSEAGYFNETRGDLA
jgi:hypothetical protein